MTNWELFLSKHSRRDIICAVSKEHCSGCFIERACYGEDTDGVMAFLDAEAERDRKSYEDGYRKGYENGVRVAKKALDEETKALFDEWSAKVLSRFAYDRDFVGEVDNDES